MENNIIALWLVVIDKSFVSIILGEEDMQCIGSDIIASEIFYFDFVKRHMIPETFLEDKVGVTLEFIRQWECKLKRKDKECLLLCLKGDKLDIFINEYYNQPLEGRDEVLFLTTGAVRSLLQFVGKKEGVDKQVLNLILEEFSSAFHTVNCGKIKKNVFYDSVIDDIYQNKSNIATNNAGNTNNIHISKTSGAIVNVGDSNVVHQEQHQYPKKTACEKYIKTIVLLVLFVIIAIVVCGGCLEEYGISVDAAERVFAKLVEWVLK